MSRTALDWQSGLLKGNGMKVLNPFKGFAEAVPMPVRFAGSKAVLAAWAGFEFWLHAREV